MAATNPNPICQSCSPLNWNEEEIDPEEAVTKQEEEVLTKESEDTNPQWNEKDSGASMPFSRKVANLMIALVATTLAISASYVPTAADSSVPQLQ